MELPAMRFPRPMSPATPMDLVVSPGASWEETLDEETKIAWESLVHEEPLSDGPRPHGAWIARFRNRVEKTLITCRSLANGLSVLADEMATAPTGSQKQADEMQVDDDPAGPVDRQQSPPSSSRGKKRYFEDTTSHNIQMSTKRRLLLGKHRSE